MALGGVRKVAKRGVSFEARRCDPAQVVAGRLARIAHRVDPRPVAQHAGEEVVGARGELGAAASMSSVTAKPARSAISFIAA